MTATLRVLFLGPLRERLGCDFVEVPCPTDGTQETLWKNLREKFPALPSNSGELRLARHHDFLDANDRLQPGDEIAIIPPVSGG